MSRLNTVLNEHQFQQGSPTEEGFVGTPGSGFTSEGSAHFVNTWITHAGIQFIKKDTELKGKSRVSTLSREQGAESFIVGINQDIAADFPQILKPLRPVNTRTIPLKEWEGHVTEIVGDKFVASLYSSAEDGEEREDETEFDFNEVSDSDKELLKLGAVFSWIIGYQIKNGTQRQTVSYLVFRRLPAYRRSQLERAKLEAKRLSKTFGSISD